MAAFTSDTGRKAALKHAEMYRAVRADCLCGCGRKVGKNRNKWATRACVPGAIRKASRRKTIYKTRRERFRRLLQSFLSSDRTLTMEAMMEALEQAYRLGLKTGWEGNKRGTLPIALSGSTSEPIPPPQQPDASCFVGVSIEPLRFSQAERESCITRP